MSTPWRIINLERVQPFDPDNIWASFDLELNSGEVARDISLFQNGKRFELRGVELAPDTREAVIHAALAEIRRRPA